MADRVGFEPTVRLHAHTLSKRAHSTTLTPVRFVPQNRLFGRGGRKLSSSFDSGNTEITFILRFRAFNFPLTVY